MSYNPRPYTESQRICYTIKEVAEMLGVTRQTVQNIIHRGDLARVKIGARNRATVRIMKEDLDAFINRCKEVK